MIPFAHALLRDHAEVIVTAPASGAATIAEETAKLPPVDTATAILRAFAKG